MISAFVNAVGRLAQVTLDTWNGNPANYDYDAEGQRVRRQVGSDSTEYIYFGGQVIAERDQAGTWTDYVFAGGRRLAKAPATAATSGTEYYHGDHLGSSRMMTNASGTPIWEATYLPFGQEHNPQLTTNHYKFTGKERDSESGLDFFIARYYSSGYGRFLSPDEFTGGPVDAFSSSDPLPPGPLPYADITNPQSLNKYTYALNNPLFYVDPEGHDNLPADSVPDGLDSGGCEPGAPVCGDGKKKKKGSIEVAGQDIDRGIGKALANELTELQNSANALARMSGEKDVPADTALLQPDTPGEKAVMTTMSFLLLASAAGGGRRKAARELGEQILERHHRLPREFEKIFKRLELDIEGFTQSISRAKHRLKPDGLHIGPNNYNKRWREFFKRTADLTRRKVLRFLDSLDRKGL